MASECHLPANTTVLKSWKDIANYLGCGIRTVQRYEHSSGLPVRRVPGRSRGAVFALADELEGWLHEDSNAGLSKTARLTASVQALRGSITDGTELRRQSRTLRMANLTALEKLTHTVALLLVALRN